MRTNPMVKPQTSSGWAVTLTVISSVCLITAVSIFFGRPDAWVAGLFFMVITVIMAGLATAIWIARIRRANLWISKSLAQWEHFYAVKSRLGVTTEVTVLDIDALDPTGTWVTIRWEKFAHIQRAWMEAIPDEIWRGSVLLISPDPAQIHVHGPWPEIYYLLAADYHAFAPAAALSYLTNPKYLATAKANGSRG